MPSWGIALSEGLKAVSQCMIRHTYLPAKSAKIIASTLHTFLTSPQDSQAKCAENCLKLINNTDITGIRNEYLVLRDTSELHLFIFLLVLAAGLVILFGFH